MPEVEKKPKPLDALRERRGPVPDALRERVKAHNRIQKAIGQSLADGPKTAPEIAEATGARADEVFWHLMAMRKYGKVAEDEQDGDYFRYALIEKDEK